MVGQVDVYEEAVGCRSRLRGGVVVWWCGGCCEEKTQPGLEKVSLPVSVARPGKGGVCTVERGGERPPDSKKDVCWPLSSFDVERSEENEKGS